MPNKTIYVHEDNLDKWNKIANRSDWINTVLRNADDTSEWGQTTMGPVGPMITTLTEIVSPERKANGMCKIHGTPLDGRGRCLQKGCKYS